MALEIKVPAVGESITEVTVSQWLKNDGDYVEMDEVICELESDKATFELNAEASGVLKTMAGEGDTIEVGAVICSIDTDASAPASTAPEKSEEKAAVIEEKAAPAKESTPANSNYASGTPSPAAGKILTEKGIDPASVNGTGKDGRITKEDALNASSPAKSSKTETPAVAPSVFGREVREEKMSNLRKTVAKRLVSAKNETAMLTTFNEVDMKPIMDIRKKYKEAFKEKHEIGLGFMSFFTKAICEALKEYPSVNAYINGENIEFHDYCDISIAVSAPKGLVVPVIRNAESLSLAEIEKEVSRLAGKARDNKLSIEEMTGGTFTITNGGVFGSMMSTPIINPPQSAILGMHNIVERPMAINGEVVIRPMMYVALSYDHRIIDGRESVSFLVKVKQLLEDPVRLMLGV
ncbi:MAG: 2-oxoglutarate dehydrogenase complex dihydrolipoyllysine-residue succinyltransferase [Bacteroidetes bacterium]|nr:2-oxoglutarate dehydrogenase complex dihydrolipoyllysine-residue succinyltransferase [Bacteroidota bacterium]